MDTITTTETIRVLVNGHSGRMGSETVKAVCAQDDMQLVGGFDPTCQSEHVFLDGVQVAPAFLDLEQAIAQAKPTVIVDFTLPSVVADNLRIALQHGIDCVVGTTGMSQETLEGLIATAPEKTTLFVAPNFTTGAILMMAAAKMAASYFPDVEVLEFHHNNKADAPSGTAINTARALDMVRRQASITTTAPGNETELTGLDGARGANIGDVRLHAIRSNGFVASQEIIFGSPGQTLTIRHDSIDRSSYMPGVLLAIRSVGSRSGLLVGLEELMNL
jgi:4-hydroxy-tetrahydrodipicolinate reductase